MQGWQRLDFNLFKNEFDDEEEENESAATTAAAKCPDECVEKLRDLFLSNINKLSKKMPEQEFLNFIFFGLIWYF